mgnify:CR=1 FL=1
MLKKGFALMQKMIFCLFCILFGAGTLLAVEVCGEPKHIAAIRKKAEAGDVESQSLLGSHFYLDLADGRETQEKAVKWLRAAATQGHVQSQYFLGRIFATSCPEKYFRKDDEVALKWWRMAAETGYADACKSLGNVFFEGHGVRRDRKESFKWYRKAAEQGDHRAQRRLGEHYRFGHGVSKDLVKAYAWYELALHCMPEWQRPRLGDRASLEVDRETLAQKMSLEQSGKAQKLAKELLKEIEVNKKK